MKESDIRLLMEISPDNSLMPGWQRGVERQRAKTTRAGDLLYVKSYPIWDTTHSKDAAATLLSNFISKPTSYANLTSSFWRACKRAADRKISIRTDIILNFMDQVCENQSKITFFPKFASC